MILSMLFDRFVKKTPVSVMTRAAMEYTLAPKALDELFDDIADRNFCTLGLLTGIAKRKAYHLIRQHANLPIVSPGTLRRCGRKRAGGVSSSPRRSWIPKAHPGRCVGSLCDWTSPRVTGTPRLRS